MFALFILACGRCVSECNICCRSFQWTAEWPYEAALQRMIVFYFAVLPLMSVCANCTRLIMLLHQLLNDYSSKNYTEFHLTHLNMLLYSQSVWFKLPRHFFRYTLLLLLVGFRTALIVDGTEWTVLRSAWQDLSTVNLLTLTELSDRMCNHAGSNRQKMCGHVEPVGV